jgi:hypothetical protein
MTTAPVHLLLHVIVERDRYDWLALWATLMATPLAALGSSLRP